MEKKTKIMNLKIDDENRTAELILYGDIGDSFWEDISSREIVHELDSLDVDNIILNINSNGGGTTSAIAISNALKRHKAKVIANIDGIAASAATIITSACDIVRMPKNALFMIHNPWTVAIGDEKDFEKMAETLSKVKNSIMETYVAKTGLNKEKLSELMDKESWFSANEAKEYGFINEIIENTDILQGDDTSFAASVEESDLSALEYIDSRASPFLYVDTPMLIVTLLARLKFFFSTALRIFSAKAIAPFCSVSGRSNTNSSPPHRAKQSVSRIFSLITSAKVFSTKSPMLCPYSSLICLNLSMSIIANAIL